MTESRHAHGVTPGLRQDYVKRVASHKAAFLLPFHEPGMTLLDIGCGPRTVSLGLSGAVEGGTVTGIDHDWTHVQAAASLASNQGSDNLKFHLASAFALPFADASAD